MFAIITAILYAWGLRNDLRQEKDLQSLLLNKSAGKIIRYLKKHKTATKKEICEQIKKVSSGFFWSKKKAKVSNPEKFGEVLINYMISQQLIQIVHKKGYQLRKK